MLDRILFDKTNVSFVAKGLDASAMRHKSISDNVANALTPGYRRTKVRFEEDLHGALRLQGYKTHGRHVRLGRKTLAEVQPKMYRAEDTSDASGVNNVDIEREMAHMAKNQIYYNALAKIISMKFTGLRTASRGRSA